MLPPEEEEGERLSHAQRAADGGEMGEEGGEALDTTFRPLSRHSSPPPYPLLGVAAGRCFIMNKGEGARERERRVRAFPLAPPHLRLIIGGQPEALPPPASRAPFALLHLFHHHLK